MILRRIRAHLTRARLRRIHEQIEIHERYIATSATTIDRLLGAERTVRVELFALENPHLFRGHVTSVYGTTAP